MIIGVANGLITLFASEGLERPWRFADSRHRRCTHLNDMGARASILIVDDDPEFAGLLAEFLATAGFETLAANSVDEALAIVRTQQVRAIVSDIQMKPRSGYELAKEVHSLDASIPVVLMSSFESPQSTREANEAGASAFLCKPFHLDDLLSLIGSAVAAD